MHLDQSLVHRLCGLTLCCSDSEGCCGSISEALLETLLWTGHEPSLRRRGQVGHSVHNLSSSWCVGHLLESGLPPYLIQLGNSQAAVDLGHLVGVPKGSKPTYVLVYIP